MFQSIQWPSILAGTVKGEESRCEYRLTDSEFGTVSVILLASYSTFSNAVIKAYSERQLNVAANLARYFQWYEIEYHDESPNGMSSVAEQIKRLEEYHPSYFTPELREQVKKYLVLL